MAVATATNSQPTLTVKWKPSPKGRAARISVMASLLFGLIVLIATVQGFQASRLAEAAIFAIVGLSMNLLLGYAGQISLGHQAFFGIGAFTSASLVTNANQDFAVGLVMAMMSGALAALLIGGIALRVSGLYLALVTLAYGALAEATIFQFRFFGGGSSIEAARPHYAMADSSYAYLCFAILGVIIYLDYRFIKSKAGRAVQAIRDSERVAASMGINVRNYKLLAFVLSGLLAGLAGGLFAHQTQSVDVGPFNFTLALTFVLMTVVGGLGSRVGVIIGSMFFALLDKYFAGIFESLTGLPGLGGLANIVAEPSLLVPAFGALLLILTLIQFPGGIGQQIKPITTWLAGGKFNMQLMHEKVTTTQGPDVRP